jgi:hypothetical protein
MIEMKCHWVLIVDQQRSVREGRLLQKTGQCLAGDPVASEGPHEAIYLDHFQTSLRGSIANPNRCLVSMTAFQR